jgi:hypothetical protein
VHGDGLADNETIFGELTDCLAGVGGRDFGRFIRIEPNLALSAVQDVRRKALLSAEVDPTTISQSVSIALRWGREWCCNRPCPDMQMMAYYISESRIF